MEITAQSTTDKVYCLGGAVAAGAGASATGALVFAEVTPQVNASTLDNVSIYSDSALRVSADAAIAAEAELVSVSISAGVSAGISYAMVELDPAITASLGAGNTIDVDGLQISATQSIVDGYDDSASVWGLGAAGSLGLSVQGTVLYAKNYGDAAPLSVPAPPSTPNWRSRFRLTRRLRATSTRSAPPPVSSPWAAVAPK